MGEMILAGVGRIDMAHYLEHFIMNLAGSVRLIAIFH
jgi:hypothetical protein